MKRSLIVLLGLILTVSLHSQEIISNPAKPLNPDAGRRLMLKPVFRVDDSSGEFFFRNPYEIQIDSRGIFYVKQMNPEQILKFSPEGKFIANLLKTGQGPGEIGEGSLASFVVWRDDVYLCEGGGKFIRIDKDGRLAGEVRADMPRSSRLLAVTEDGYFVTGRKADYGRPSGLIDVEHEILFVSLDGKRSEKIAAFTTQLYREGRSLQGIGAFLHAAASDGRTLYASDRSAYEVTRIDLTKRKIAARLARPYTRVKAKPPSSASKERLRKLGAKPFDRDYLDDIGSLYVCDNNLWVETSTRHEDRGGLFDVFDLQGRYVDSFYFRGPGGYLFPVDGGSLFVISQNAEGLYVIRKFQVLNGPKASSRP